MTGRRGFVIVMALLWALLPAAPAHAVACTVPGDKATIAAALADPACDPIIVSAGTYAEGPLTVSRSVTIRGPNAGVPGAATTRAAEARITSASDGFRLAGGAVTLEGLQIEAPAAGVTTTGTPSAVAIRDSVLGGSTAVSVSATGPVELRTNRATANGDGVGLRVTGGTAATVQGNRVEDVVRTTGGTTVEALGIDVAGITGLVAVRDNAVVGTRTGVAGTFTSTYAIRTLSGNAAGIELTGNTVRNTGCDFNGCTAYGIYGFMTFGSGGPITASGNDVDGTHVHAATSINTAEGIFVFSSSGTVQVLDNRVTQSTATGNSITGARGIQAFSDAAPVLVANNVVQGMTASGTSIASADGILAGRDGLAGIRVVTNQVRQVNGIGPTGQGNGVTSFAFEGSAFAEGNIVEDVNGTGVIVSGKVDATARDNTVQRAGAGGVQTGGGEGVGLAEGNTVRSVTGPALSLNSGYEPAQDLRAYRNDVRGVDGPAITVNTFNFDDPEFHGSIDVARNALLDAAVGVQLQSVVRIAADASARIAANRIVGNAFGVEHLGEGPVDATNNWWGCNAGPGQPGCDTVSAPPDPATVAFDPWLVLTAEASPSVIANTPTSEMPQQAQVTARLTRNSAGQDTTALGTVPDGTPVAFATTRGSITPAAAGTVDGTAVTTLSSAEAGPAVVSATVDNATASAPVEVRSPPRSVTRIFGSGRIETAAEVAAVRFPAAEVVFLATADNFPDALAGGPLAARSRAPILLTGARGLAGPSARELARLRPRRIVVLGGTAVLPDSVVAEAAAAAGGATVERASGPDRYGTAAAIAARYPAATRVYLATGQNFPDALTGAALAAARDDGPVALTQRTALPAVTRAQLERLRPREIVVLGGTAVVSDAVAQQAAAAAGGATVVRLAGSDRFGTSGVIAAQFPAPTDEVYIATGSNFPDALAGTPAAALTRSPVLLTRAAALPAPTVEQLRRLLPLRIRILGGSAVVSPAVEADLARYLRP